MQNRAILITLRAAAIVIIATGLNDVIATAVPRYEPLYLYLAGIALVSLLDGVVLGVITALLCLVFYAMLFTPRADLLTARMAVPVVSAIGVAIVFSVLRGVIRARRRRHAVTTVVPAAPALLETSAVAHVSDNTEVLAAIDELRGELRAAVTDLTAARAREEELYERTRNDRAEREAVEARTRKIEEERDWALRQLSEAREESASMAGRQAELELSAHERDREAATLRARITELEEEMAAAAPPSEFDELRRALADTRNARDRARAETVAEKQRADGFERAISAARAEAEERVAEVERATRERGEAALTEERATRQRLEANLADARKVAEVLEATLTEERSAREKVEASLAEQRTARERNDAALVDERAIREQLASTLAELRKADDAVKAEAHALRTRVTELESTLAEERGGFDAKLQTIVTHLASDHETDLGQAMSEKEEARAEARALSMKLATVQHKLDEAEAEIARLRADGAKPAPAKPRILVVHPDADVRGAAGASLERAGYEVVSAADGLEALRVAIARQPEVVIAESSMPKMDGRELCQLLKSQEKTAHIRFILLMRAGDDAPRGELTPDEVLRKPVPVETLKATLAGLLASSRQ